MAEQATPKPTTRRVVLAGATVNPETLDLPPEVKDKLSGSPVTVWVEVGEADGGDKRGAVKALVGEIPGQFRAPSARSWRGGIGFRPPEQQRMETVSFD